MQAQFKPAIQRIRDLYNEAEVDLKSYGRVNNRLFVPGVNQLRYAGQHLVRALGATDEEAAKSNLDAAERHAQRALYDINDAAIQYHLAGISRIRTKYFVNLNAIVPKYQEVVDTVRNARKTLSESVMSTRMTESSSIRKRECTWLNYMMPTRL